MPKREFKPTQKKCNVLMRDVAGSHRLNEDFPWNWTPRMIMDRYGFTFAKNSVTVNSFPIPDEALDEELVVFLRSDTVLDGYWKTMRLLIMGKAARPVKSVIEEIGGVTV